MFNYLLKNLSILKKFLFINLIFFSVIGLFTFLYLKNIQPNLIKNKSSNHIKIINNTVDNLDRLELEILNEEKSREITENKNINIGNDNLVSLQDILFNYAGSKNFGIPFTFTQQEFNNFKLTTIKNVFRDDVNIGYIAITENANDVRAAIDERKTFILRTAFAVGIVILIFSFVLNRYFLKPIQNLVNYTNKIKNKEHKKINIDNLKSRNDELGLLSKSLDDMTLEL